MVLRSGRTAKPSERTWRLKALFRLKPSPRLSLLGGATTVSSAEHMSKTVGPAVIDRVAPELHNRVGPWLQTREGVASASVSLVVFSVLWAGVGAPLLSALLAAGFAIILVSLAAR